jgi:hypothetical protein
MKVFVLVTILMLPLPIFGQIWVARYNGPADSTDGACAIAVDGLGNVYVTGSSVGVGTSYDYVTIKYNSSGDTLWVRRYNGFSNFKDYAHAIAVDCSGYVYVTGVSYSGTSYEYGDYATIKYDSLGNTIWVRRYNGPDNDHDGAHAIAIDGSGNVYVTGGSRGVGTESDCATIKYNSLGDTVWVRRYDGPANHIDWASAIAVDDNGNVYVTGSSVGVGTSNDYVTIKYNSSGDTLWVRKYDGPNHRADVATAIAVDTAENVYVTGYSYVGVTSRPDYATIKYNSAGDEKWVRRYNGPGNYWDEAYAIAVDGSGNVYVTGRSGGAGTDNDYATIKYNSAGDALWVRRYNGPGNYHDGACGIAVDGDYVYVTGSSGWWAGTSCPDYATVKYNSAGNEVWVRRYDGPSNDYDGACGIAVDGDYVYVTGSSLGSGTDADYATIKYSAEGVEESSNRKTRNAKLEIYPNPFSQSIVIKYQLPVRSRVSLEIYDITGRLVKTIVNEEKEAGNYKVGWNTKGFSSGVYFVTLVVGDYKEIQKLILMR